MPMTHGGIEVRLGQHWKFLPTGDTWEITRLDEPGATAKNLTQDYTDRITLLSSMAVNKWVLVKDVLAEVPW